MDALGNREQGTGNSFFPLLPAACCNRAKRRASLRLALRFGFFKGFLSYIRGLYARLTPLKNGIFMIGIPFKFGVFIKADSFEPMSMMTEISRNPDKRNYFFIFRDLTSCELMLRFMTAMIRFLTIGCEGRTENLGEPNLYRTDRRLTHRLPRIDHRLNQHSKHSHAIARENIRKQAIAHHSDLSHR